MFGPKGRKVLPARLWTGLARSRFFEIQATETRQNISPRQKINDERFRPPIRRRTRTNTLCGCKAGECGLRRVPVSAVSSGQAQGSNVLTGRSKNEVSRRTPSSRRPHLMTHYRNSRNEPGDNIEALALVVFEGENRSNKGTNYCSPTSRPMSF